MTPGEDQAAEVVADCPYAADGLPAAALAGSAAELYRPLNIGSEPRGPRQHDRRKIAEILAVSNQGWGHPQAQEMASTLADPAARVVVSGQQPGILGGPLYTLVKALTAVRWAERLTEQGESAVAVFWVAGEDHDFREVASTTWMKGSELLSASLGEDGAPLLPVGKRLLGPGIDEVLASWRRTLPSDFWQAEADRLAQHYQPETTFTDAFASYLIAILGERAPLVLDAQDADLKRLERPALERLIERRQQVAEIRVAQNERIRAAGFDLQVPPRDGAAPLFLHQNSRRRRILWRAGGSSGNGGFALDAEETTHPIDELLRALEDDPASVSPSALARPPIQDAVLGTSLFVVGPGEMAYLAQSAPLYDLMGIEAPALLMRPSLALLARRKADNARDLDLPLAEIATGVWDGEGFLATRAGTNPVLEAAADLEAFLHGLKQKLTAVDPNLEQPMDKTRDNIAQAMKRLQSKVDASLARSDELAAKRTRETESLLLPGGQPQERVLSTAWALGRFGPDLPDRLASAIDLKPGSIQVIAL